MRVRRRIPERNCENDVGGGDSQITPVGIHLRLAPHALCFLAATPRRPPPARTIGQNGGGRERPPSSRPWYGHGAVRVFTHPARPFRGSLPTINPSREDHRTPVRRLDLVADLVCQRRLRHLAGMIRFLGGPVPKARPEAVRHGRDPQGPEQFRHTSVPEGERRCPPCRSCPRLGVP